MNVKWKFRMKFYGKLMTYWALVLAIGGVILFNIPMVIAGLGFITVGCLLHEFSEN